MKILIAIRGSEESIEMVSAAAKLFNDIKDLSVILLHVQQPSGSYQPRIPSSVAGGGQSYQLQREIRALEQTETLRLLQHAASLVEDMAQQTLLLEESGSPVDRILAVADENDVDMIVIGRRETTWLQQLTGASVGSVITQRSKRPVLVLP